MVKKVSNTTPSRASPRKPRVPKESGDEEERILREATKHLVFRHGMFLVATGLREARIKRLRVWIITVTLRYTTGHEGYLGDLLYDGEEFTFLTPPEVRKNGRGRLPLIPSGCGNGMSIELPLYRQEKDNTCALACLRMVLAAFGTNVAERELENQAHLQEEGTLIDEVERLAREFHLSAEIQDTTVEDLRGTLRAGKLPVAYIDPAVFELNPRQRARHSIRDAIIHTVIPTRVTARSVTFHDPRPPAITRKAIRLFRQAYMSLGGRCIVCAKS